MKIIHEEVQMPTNNQRIIELPQTSSRIGAKSKYDGVLKFEKSMGILGEVNGEIIGGELLVVYSNAKVLGNILVDYLLVIGRIEGNIHARRGVYFYEGAVVRGSVLSAIIRMQTGVDFEGECNLIEKEDVDIFSLSREVFRSSMFDKLVHELDERSTKKA